MFVEWIDNAKQKIDGHNESIRLDIQNTNQTLSNLSDQINSIMEALISKIDETKLAISAMDNTIDSVVTDAKKHIANHLGKVQEELQHEQYKIIQNFETIITNTYSGIKEDSMQVCGEMGAQLEKASNILEQYICDIDDNWASLKRSINQYATSINQYAKKTKTLVIVLFSVTCILFVISLFV